MKKRITWLWTVLLVSLSLQAAQVLYVYRSDSVIEAFYTSEIDSIRYSQYDMDSVWHDSCQVQEIWTADSIYRVPLAIVDSISFYTPPTVYQQGVEPISADFMDYVIWSDVDSLRLLLSTATPSAILPQVGSKIVTTEMNDKFPIGFMGRVEQVLPTDSGYIVNCSLLSLTDVFETYYNYSSVYGDTVPAENDGPNQAKYWGIDPINYNGEKQFNIPTISYSIPLAEIPVGSLAGLAVSYGTEIKASTTPRFHVRSFISVNKQDGYYYSCSITGTLENNQVISVSGNISWDKDFRLSSMKIKLPIAPFVSFYTELGITLKAGAKMSMSISTNQKYKFAGMRDWSQKKKELLKPEMSMELVKRDITIEGSLEGSVSAGLYLEEGICVIDRKIGSAKFREEGGIQLQGGTVLYQQDLQNAYVNTDLYDLCEDGNIECDFYINYALKKEVLGNVETLADMGTVTVKVDDWDIVPTFENISFQSYTPGVAQASVEMQGDLLIPVSVGLTVRDEEDNEVDTYYDPVPFDNSYKKVSHTFTNLSDDHQYTVYPVVKLLGHDVLATPSAELDKHELIKITQFVVTDSAYDADQSFIYDNVPYSYKFDCAVTVELDAESAGKNIADWGYAYIDLNNDTAYISLMGNSSPYTDTRYAYYRNESISTVTLKPYILFAGETERTWGTTKVFKLNYGVLACVGEDHPHMVDLGLPSGTLWSCTNLGATRPEEVGDYYAYGETTAKTYFTQNNYLYFEYNGGYSYYTSIGANISGTTYDAASVNWQDGWRMPTRNEIIELMDSCTWVWTARNTVEGFEVTGPNGNSIFLPVAPVMDGRNYGTMTYYRSSFINGNSYGDIYAAGTDAIGFKANDTAPRMGSPFRFMGTVIRPVKTKQQ